MIYTYSVSYFPCYSTQELTYISGFHEAGHLLVDTNTGGEANLTRVVSAVDANASLTSTLRFSPLEPSINNTLIACLDSGRESSSENITLAGRLSCRSDQ